MVWRGLSEVGTRGMVVLSIRIRDTMLSLRCDMVVGLGYAGVCCNACKVRH